MTNQATHIEFVAGREHRHLIGADGSDRLTGSTHGPCEDRAGIAGVALTRGHHAGWVVGVIRGRDLGDGT